jgi:hypothetical protein
MTEEEGKREGKQEMVVLEQEPGEAFRINQ